MVLIESAISASRNVVARRAISAPFAGLQSRWWHVVRPAASRAPRHALVEVER